MRHKRFGGDFVFVEHWHVFIYFYYFVSIHIQKVWCCALRIKRLYRLFALCKSSRTELYYSEFRSWPWFFSYSIYLVAFNVWDTIKFGALLLYSSLVSSWEHVTVPVLLTAITGLLAAWFSWFNFLDYALESVVILPLIKLSSRIWKLSVSFWTIFGQITINVYVWFLFWLSRWTLEYAAI